MMNRNENWHQNVKNKHREELITAGKALFLKHSFLNVSIKDVCERAGISRVTFYKHFQSLDELIFEVQMQLLESMADDVEHANNSALSGREQLNTMLRAWNDYAREYPSHLKFILQFDLHYEAYESNKELKERYALFVRKGQEELFLIPALQAGIQDGSLKPDLDPRESARFIFTAMMGLLQKMSLVPAEMHNSDLEETPIPRQFVEMLVQYFSA